MVTWKNTAKAFGTKVIWFERITQKSPKMFEHRFKQNPRDKKKKLWSRYTPCDDSMYRLTTSTDYALFVPVNKLSLVDKQSKLGRVIGIANWCVLWISDKWLSVTFCFFVLLLDFLISHHRLKSFSAYLLFFFCASTFKLTWKQQTNRKKNKWSFGEVMYIHHELTHRNGWQRMNRQWNLKIE